MRLQSRSFGVLEIILSVAILSAFSVFVLRLFVAANNEEKTMLELDRANYAAVSYIEQFKSSSAPFAICSRLGTAGPSGDQYAAAVPVEGRLRAQIRIYKETSNDAGALYRMDVAVSDSGGTDVLQLSGVQFFAR